MQKTTFQTVQNSLNKIPQAEHPLAIMARSEVDVWSRDPNHLE